MCYGLSCIHIVQNSFVRKTNIQNEAAFSSISDLPLKSEGSSVAGRTFQPPPDRSYWSGIGGQRRLIKRLLRPEQNYHLHLYFSAR